MFLLLLMFLRKRIFVYITIDSIIFSKVRKSPASLISQITHCTRLNFRHFLECGVRSSPRVVRGRNAGAFPKQQLVIELNIVLLVPAYIL